MPAASALFQPLSAVALLAAGVMGFAIQRGGTCMVAAVDEAVSRRRPRKLVALGESALWVSGLFALATLFGLMDRPVATHHAGVIALSGGLVLGLGALANGACVFGSVARIGSRDWHFLLTPAGFFLGSLVHARLALPTEAEQLAPADRFGGWILVALVALLVAYRTYELAAAQRRGAFLATLWHPHRATIVIGVAFVVLALVAGPWTYPEALWRTAHRGVSPTISDTLLFAALLGGAVIGGWRGDTGATWSARAAAGCLGGGALMGLGSAMIPGGNDNLSLVGIPMRHGYAVLAIGAMALAIVLGLAAKAQLRRRPARPYTAHLPPG